MASADSDPTVPPVAEYVIKVTSRCDLACDHCYVYEDPHRLGGDSRFGWIYPSFVLAATRIAEYAVRHGLSGSQLSHPCTAVSHCCWAHSGSCRS